MNQDKRSLLKDATDALRADVPDAEKMNASMQQMANKLGIEVREDAVQSCEGMREMLNGYRAGTLTEARRLLVEAHLHECGTCLRRLHEERAAVDWSAPPIAVSTPHNARGWAWGMAFATVLLLAGVFAYRAYWLVPPGVRAEVQSVQGQAYVLSASGSRLAGAGAALYEGDQLRTSGDSHAVVRLADGSTVQINQRSTLGVGARGKDMTVALNHGAVIVEAAHRKSGHLYVQTPDCRVGVTGTIFSVDAGLKGSRVGVLQGSVQVAHAGVKSMLQSGQQFASNDNLAPEPLEQQFSWSPDRQKFIGIMAQLANIQHEISKIPFPEPRSSRDLLPRMPANTQLYVSIPNLGEFLSEANTVFQEQLSQSPELQQWWSRGSKHNGNDLNEAVAKIRDISDYLGDEVVVAGVSNGTRPEAAIIADVQRSGLKDELEQQFSKPDGGLTVLDQASLATASGGVKHGGYALVRPHEVVFAGSLDTLKLFNASLDAGSSGFASSGFGSQISAAYKRGAGMILAADLHSMLRNGMARVPHAEDREKRLESTGLSGVQYLIAEHRERNGIPANHLNLQFMGTRQRVASWLGSPAPMGSLDFVSPNAAIAAATLTKDPASIADDLMAIASQGKNGARAFSDLDSKLQVSVRDDLMANLGGEFLLALDGPVLPTPAWKMVIEVNNPQALENTLERMTKAIDGQLHGPKAHPVVIEPSTADGRQYYAIRDKTTGTILAQYTFAGGYMIVAPERALLMEALKTRDSGNSLGRSTAFRALLPRDENENYSAIAYQNLNPVLTPLLSQFSGSTAEALRKLAADSRPTVICAWGKDNRIEAASDSRLFGFDFLTMGALLNAGNKSRAQHVNN